MNLPESNRIKVPMEDSEDNWAKEKVFKSIAIIMVVRKLKLSVQYEFFDPIFFFVDLVKTNRLMVL